VQFFDNKCLDTFQDNINRVGEHNKVVNPGSFSSCQQTVIPISRKAENNCRLVGRNLQYGESIHVR